MSTAVMVHSLVLFMAHVSWLWTGDCFTPLEVCTVCTFWYHKKLVLRDGSFEPGLPQVAMFEVHGVFKNRELFYSFGASPNLT